MASSQPVDGGARPKTNLQSNSRHQTSRKEKSFRTKNPSSQQRRENCDNLSGSDIEEDTVPNSEQGNVPPRFHVPPVSPPHLVDVAVIYAERDYDEVVEEFVPWLKRIAEKFNLVGARIHLYDDPDVNPNINIFKQADTMAVKCMKIFAFITDNFKGNVTLTGILQELLMMTRFKEEDEVRKRISDINKNGQMHPVLVKYIFECIQLQQENAIIPVQTVKHITVTGLRSTIAVLYYDLDEQTNYKEKRVKDLIEVAMNDRNKLQGITNRENRERCSYEHPDAREYPQDEKTTFRNRDQSPYKHPNASSLENLQATFYNCLHGTHAQVISNSRPHGNIAIGQQCNNFTDNDTSDDFNGTSSEALFTSNQLGPDNNMPVLEQKTKADVSRTANTDCIPESSNTIGSQQERSAEPSLESDEGGNDSRNDQDACLGSYHQSQVSSTESPTPEPKTLVHSNPAATPASSNGNDTSKDDLEIDQLESRRANNTEIKTKFSAITESGYDSISGHGQLQQKDDPKPVKEPEEISMDNTGLENDSRETSLDNTGLVNDSGNAALRKDSCDANMKFSKQESMLSIDAHKDEKESPLCVTKWQSSIEDQVLEHTLTYSGRPELYPSDGMVQFQDGSDVSGNLSSFEVTCNSSWQSEAENVLGPSFTNELESLAASGEDTIQPHQWDAVKPGDCITNGQQNEAADHEGQGQVGTERQLSVIGGPNPAVSSMQLNSLFVSTLNVKTYIPLGNLKTNVLGMMFQSSTILQDILRTDHHKRDDDDADDDDVD